MGSNKYIKTSIYHLYFISVENTRTELDIDHDKSTHWKPVWGREKKDPSGGTCSPHKAQLTPTSAQSEASLKVRGDISTRINHEHGRPEASPSRCASTSLTEASIRCFSPGFSFCLCVIPPPGFPLMLRAQMFLDFLHLCVCYVLKSRQLAERSDESCWQENKLNQTYNGPIRCGNVSVWSDEMLAVPFI